MQIAFYTEARRVGISPQQPSLGQTVSAVPCCCCAKQPQSWTELLRLHLCRLPFTLRRVELASAHSNQAWDRLYLLCHAAAVQNSPTAGLQSAAFTPMQIAFYTEARRVGISPQQPSLGQIVSAVPCCCCAKQPYSWTELLHLHLCRLPFTLRRVELASAHSNQAWDRLYLELDCAMLLLCKTALQLD